MGVIDDVIVCTIKYVHTQRFRQSINRRRYLPHQSKHERVLNCQLPIPVEFASRNMKVLTGLHCWKALISQSILESTVASRISIRRSMAAN